MCFTCACHQMVFSTHPSHAHRKPARRLKRMSPRRCSRLASGLLCGAYEPTILTSVHRTVVPVSYLFIDHTSQYTYIYSVVQCCCWGQRRPPNAFCRSKLPATSNAADVDCTRFSPTHTPALPTTPPSSVVQTADVDCTRFRPTPTPLLSSPSTALT